MSRVKVELNNADVHTVSGTALVTIFPASEKAAHENFENNTLLKAAGTVGQIGAKPKL